MNRERHILANFEQSSVLDLRKYGRNPPPEKIFKEILDQQEEEYEMELLSMESKSKGTFLFNQEEKQNVQILMHSLNTKRDQLCRQNQELKQRHISTEEVYVKEMNRRKQMQVILDIMNL